MRTTEILEFQRPRHTETRVDGFSHVSVATIQLHAYMPRTFGVAQRGAMSFASVVNQPLVDNRKHQTTLKSSERSNRILIRPLQLLSSALHLQRTVPCMR